MTTLVFLQVAQTFMKLWVTLTQPTYQVPLWSAHFNQGIPVPLTTVQTHPTLTWSTGTLPPPRVEWPPSISFRNSEETPLTTISCLQGAAPSVWRCGEGFEQVGTEIVIPHSSQYDDVPSFKILGLQLYIVQIPTYLFYHMVECTLYHSHNSHNNWIFTPSYFWVARKLGRL